MALAVFKPSILAQQHQQQHQHHVTAIELQRALSKRRHRDVLGHVVILSSCYGKIGRVAGIDGTSCIFEVPEFVIGVPPYDLSRAVSHVIASLERNGYEVSYMFPRALLISWDLERRGCTVQDPVTAPVAGAVAASESIPAKPAKPMLTMVNNKTSRHHRPISDFKSLGRFVS